jgi:hypothetical protein
MNRLIKWIAGRKLQALLRENPMLKGYGSYVVGAVLVVLAAVEAAAQTFGLDLPVGAFKELREFLLGLGIITLRRGIKTPNPS